MTPQPLSTPFAFDTEFDASGEVIRAAVFRPIKRAYGPAEVDALVAQARLEARNAALAEVESIQAMALSTIGQALAAAAPALAQVAQLHRQQAAELALTAARVVSASALDRHPEIKELRDLSEEDPKEIEASKFDLSYVALDGSIGCMVNGAGLAMATMDIIKLYGAEPANFLDVGGGATKEKVAAAFKIITADPNVKGILVNIFGGIMRCDIIAEGVIAAVKEVGLKVPLVVRLEGTNVDLGKKIIRESGLNVIPADDLDDAASKIVKAVKEAA